MADNELPDANVAPDDEDGKASTWVGYELDRAEVLQIDQARAKAGYRYRKEFLRDAVRARVREVLGAEAVAS